MMKTIHIIIGLFFAIVALFCLQGCESLLEEPVRSQFAEEHLLTTRQGVESILIDAYSKNNSGGRTRNVVKREEMTSDILMQSGGGEQGTATPLINFRWDPSNDMEALCWMDYWIVIRNANIVIWNLDRVRDFTSDQQKNRLLAEARFMRVWAYYQLWDQYGPLPIRINQDDPLELPRASEEDFKSFIEKELVEVIPGLPSPQDVSAYGRVHNGGARALLCKWYLNTHQWQKCADVAQTIIASKDFALFPDYSVLFSIENEVNSEFILVKTSLANAGGQVNNLLATSLPTQPSTFKMGLDGGLDGIVNEKWANFASNYRLYDEFYYSFHQNDTRKNRILTRYVNTNNVTVNLLDFQDQTRGIKYPPDPASMGNAHGNDFPMIRYADILLARAEALNELNGPTDESITLVNMIRNRAGLDDIQLADFESKTALREHILKERRWEFWYEGKRRRDLIRMGKFIEYAQARGITNASDKHLRFPIPQSAIDSDELLEQNDGY